MENVLTAQEWISLVALVVGSILIGNATFIAALVMLGRGILKSPVLLAYVEGLANSIPAEAREAILVAGQLAQEAADGIPAASKVGGIEVPGARDG